jgi:hypothetical protein
MKYLLYFFCLFIYNYIFSQNFSGITVNGNLRDLSFIPEPDKEITTVYTLSNTTRDTVFIKNIELPVYVTTSTQNKYILPQQSIEIPITYKIDGLPGRFFKTVIINIQINNQHISIPLSLKGYVIEKELWNGKIETYKNLIGVNVIPFTDTLFSFTDLRFMNKHKFINFINDITYEIDYTGISIIRIELKLHSFKPRTEIDKLLTLLKNNIIQELEKRKYSKQQIFFATSETLDKTIENTAIKAYINLRSENYSNEKLTKSGFIYDTLMYKTEEINYQDENIYGYLSIIDVNTALNKHPEYYTFTDRLIKAVLADGTAIVQMRYFGNTNKEIEKHYKSIQKQIIKTLANEGINTAKIEFTIPYFEQTDSEKAAIMLVHYSPLSKISQANTLQLNYTPKQDNEAKLYNDLPVYKFNYTDDKKKFEDENGEFKSWLIPIINALKENKKIRFIIEASASNAPNQEKKDNKYIARKRAEEIKKSLLFNLNQQQINQDRYTFTEPLILTQGPTYSAYLYKLSFYSQYQYIKVIPVYDTLYTEDDNKNIYPYMVNFNYNNFEIPVNSTVFQNFTERLINEINRKGYASIIIESSSSRVPTASYKDNMNLSFNRAEKTIFQLRQELINKGINPDRLIISEQRILVQGPEYSNDYHKNSFIYEQYQYIKIIPDDLFKR